jgi:hypothetical protein
MAETKLIMMVLMTRKGMIRLGYWNWFFCTEWLVKRWLLLGKGFDVYLTLLLYLFVLFHSPVFQFFVCFYDVVSLTSSMTVWVGWDWVLEAKLWRSGFDSLGTKFVKLNTWNQKAQAKSFGLCDTLTTSSFCYCKMG